MAQASGSSTGIHSTTLGCLPGGLHTNFPGSVVANLPAHSAIHIASNAGNMRGAIFSNMGTSEVSINYPVGCMLVNKRYPVSQANRRVYRMTGPPLPRNTKNTIQWLVMVPRKQRGRPALCRIDSPAQKQVFLLFISVGKFVVPVAIGQFVYNFFVWEYAGCHIQ